jgi:hypothetical protein
MNKLNLMDTISDIMVKMSDNNSGALNVLINLIQYSVVPVIILDNCKIYGSGIYILYNDKCNRDIKKFIKLLLATSINIITENKLKEMADDQLNKINLTENEWSQIENIKI